MTTYQVLQTEVTLNILPYLAYPDLLRSYCRLTKKTLQIFLDYFICHKDVEEVCEGTLQGDSREKILHFLDAVKNFVYILDLVSISPLAKAALTESGGDLRVLQFSQDLLLEFFRINVTAYSNWEGTASNPYQGIFHYVLAYIESNEAVKDFLYKEFMEDCRYWNSSKVFGDFIVLMERPDGTILVSSDCSKVYLVVGLSSSVAVLSGADAYLPMVHGSISSLLITTVLLNWQNKIVYDGFISPGEAVSEETLGKAFQAYLSALQTGSLITSLPKNEATAAQIEPFVLNEEEYELYRLKYLLELQSIDSKPHIDGFDINNPFALEETVQHYVVYRRLGYIEAESPQHILSALIGSELVGSLIMDSATPTIGEYIHLTQKYCDSKGRKPAVIAIDYTPHFEMFRRLMKDVNIHVSYYPPPSDAETFLNDATNPYLGAPGCELWLDEGLMQRLDPLER
eukprot:gene3008-3195_t